MTGRLVARRLADQAAADDRLGRQSARSRSTPALRPRPQRAFDARRHSDWRPNCARRAWPRRCSARHCPRHRESSGPIQASKTASPSSRRRRSRAPAHAAGQSGRARLTCHLSHFYYPLLAGLQPVSPHRHSDFSLVTAQMPALTLFTSSHLLLPAYDCLQGRPVAFHPFCCPRWRSPSRSPSKPPAML